MKSYWGRYVAKIDGLSLRERALVFLMLAVVLFGILNLFLLDPLMVTQKSLSLQLQQQQDELTNVQSNIQQLVQAYAVDPNAASRARLEKLQQQISETGQSLQSKQNELIVPDKMAQLLEDILIKKGQLQLVGLKTLPVSPLLEPADKKDKKQGESEAPAKSENKGEDQTASMLYKHGVEVKVSGTYAGLVGYLSDLEKLPWRMYWGKADLAVDKYPQLTLTLTLYTLSMDKTWLTI